MSIRHSFEPDALEPDTATARPVAPGTHFRQGDVLLLAVDPDGLPEKVRTVPRRGGRVVLAEGEVTGHAHAIHSPAATLLRAGTELLARVESDVRGPANEAGGAGPDHRRAPLRALLQTHPGGACWPRSSAMRTVLRSATGSIPIGGGGDEVDTVRSRPIATMSWC